jgi:hypothetical protein
MPRLVFRSLLAAGTVALLSCTHWIAYSVGEQSVSRKAAEAIVGKGSPYVDIASIAFDRAADGIGNAYNTALREGIQQCRSAVTQATTALDVCNNRLGVLVKTAEAERKKAATSIEQLRVPLVRYEQQLAGACADWANQPVCPELLERR